MAETGDGVAEQEQEQAQAQEAGSDSRGRATFEDVLCAVDGTKASLAAVEQAAQIAGPDGTMTLLAVTSATGSGRFRAAAIGPVRVRRVLERATRIAEEAGLSCESEIDPGGPPAEVIVEKARGHGLLAIGAPARSGLGAFGGGVAVATLRTFATPLLLARPADPERPVLERVLIATDGSDSSERLVSLAATLLPGAGSAILLHAQGAESRSHPHRIRAQHDALRAVVGERAHLLVEPGETCDTIVAAAEREHASLVVIGSRRLAGLGSTLGSVSRRVVHALSCSVLVIPPEHLAQRPAGAA